MNAPLPWTFKRLDTHHVCIYDAAGMVVVGRMRDVPAEDYRPVITITTAVNERADLLEERAKLIAELGRWRGGGSQGQIAAWRDKAAAVGDLVAALRAVEQSTYIHDGTTRQNELLAQIRAALAKVPS